MGTNQFEFVSWATAISIPMPELLSKLQYKNFEKGEYVEEKPRSLEDTLQLIKTFPWSEQRGIEISLTSPSITIVDDNGNYLKAAIYFNGKYCVYYFDVSHHLYEFHTENLDDVCEQVSNFFEGQIALDKYEKQFFSIGSKNHFENRTFDYKINKGQIFSYLIFMFFAGCLCGLLPTAAMLMINNISRLVSIIFIGFDVIFLATCYFIIRIYNKTKDMNLTISRGQANFQFTRDETTTTYDKRKVVELNVYGYTGKSSRIFNLMGLVFDDGSELTIPGTLIAPFDFASKFPDLQANYVGIWYLTSKFFWSYSK